MAENENIKTIIKESKKLAEINLAKKIAEIQKTRHLLNSLKSKFNFKNEINSIEVYDNSHFSGKAAVGSYIVAGKEGFLKEKYRKFNIKNSNPQDDYSMMEEVLSRRIKYGNLPNLIIIDGGKGQLSKVKTVFFRMQIFDTNIISISKGKKEMLKKKDFFV